VRVALPAHYGRVKGGIGTYARGLARALHDTAPSGSELYAPAPNGRSNVGRIGSSAGALARLRFEQVSLPRMVRRADILQLCDSRPVLVAHPLQVACVHDVSYLDYPEWYAPAARSYKRLMLDVLLARRPAALVVPSRYTRDRLLHHRPAASRAVLTVIAPGVDPPPESSSPLEEPPFFLTVATIEPRKNHGVLLAAFREARARGLQLRWRVVGEAGGASAEIMAGLRDEPGVDVLGWVDAPVLEASYQQAAFLAAPSHLEGFGFTPLEAMARDVPVVCSGGTALDETVAGAALRVDAEDRAGWTAALLRLEREEALRKELREQGQVRARSYSWRAAGESFWQLYERISNRRKP
jgi:glycosyltransferase involved in cell wall biosynthesis